MARRQFQVNLGALIRFSSRSAPPKWNSLETVLNEIKEELTNNPTTDANEKPPVLVLAYNESTCAQLVDLVKFGSQKLCWIRSKQFMEMESKPFTVPQPENQPIWPPDFVAFYDDQILDKVITLY